MMKDYLYSTLITLLLLSTTLLNCSSQDKNNGLNNLEEYRLEYNDKVLDESSDKIGTTVMKIYEDSNGNLWFGTKDNGVAKYDGNALTYLTVDDGLCGNDVANITEDEDGNMWFGTYSDMCKYDGQTFTSFPRDSEGVPALGWGWKSVKTDKNGQIWVNTHHGVFKCSNNASLASEIKFTKIDVPIDEEKKEGSSFCNTPGIISMDLVDSNDNMWFGTDGMGVYMFDGNKYSHLTKDDGLPSNNVLSIIEDKKGNIWFTCVQGLIPDNKNDGGIAYYDGHKITNFANVKAVSNTNVYTIYADSKDNVWVVAKDIGVYQYDGKGFQLYNLPEGQKLSGDFGAQSILEDSNGTMWFGFRGNLFRLDNKSLVSIAKNGPWL